MQFHLTHDISSPFAGRSGVDKCNQVLILPPNRQVRKIRIKASKNWVNEIRFLDEFDLPLGEVKADSGVGDWHEILI